MATCFGLSYFKPSSAQQVTEFTFTFNEKLCRHSGIPVGEHFIYLNSVSYWPEDGLK